MPPNPESLSRPDTGVSIAKKAERYDNLLLEDKNFLHRILEFKSTYDQLDAQEKVELIKKTQKLIRQLIDPTLEINGLLNPKTSSGINKLKTLDDRIGTDQDRSVTINAQRKNPLTTQEIRKLNLQGLTPYQIVLGIASFQASNRLNVTGVFDEETRNSLKMKSKSKPKSEMESKITAEAERSLQDLLQEINVEQFLAIPKVKGGVDILRKEHPNAPDYEKVLSDFAHLLKLDIASPEFLEFLERVPKIEKQFALMRSQYKKKMEDGSEQILFYDQLFQINMLWDLKNEVNFHSFDFTMHLQAVMDVQRAFGLEVTGLINAELQSLVKLIAPNFIEINEQFTILQKKPQQIQILQDYADLLVPELNYNLNSANLVNTFLVIKAVQEELQTEKQTGLIKDLPDDFFVTPKANKAKQKGRRR